MRIIIPAILIALLVGLLVWIDYDVQQSTAEDYYIEMIDIDDMDCVIIKQYSQVGITCDWSEHHKYQ